MTTMDDRRLDYSRDWRLIVKKMTVQGGMWRFRSPLTLYLGHMIMSVGTCDMCVWTVISIDAASSPYEGVDGRRDIEPASWATPVKKLRKFELILSRLRKGEHLKLVNNVNGEFYTYSVRNQGQIWTIVQVRVSIMPFWDVVFINWIFNELFICLM